MSLFTLIPRNERLRLLGIFLAILAATGSVYPAGQPKPAPPKAIQAEKLVSGSDIIVAGSVSALAHEWTKSKDDFSHRLSAIVASQQKAKSK